MKYLKQSLGYFARPFTTWTTPTYQRALQNLRQRQFELNCVTYSAREESLTYKRMTGQKLTSYKVELTADELRTIMSALAYLANTTAVAAARENILDLEESFKLLTKSP